MEPLSSYKVQKPDHISAELISFELSDWSQPRRTGAIHSARPS